MKSIEYWHDPDNGVWEEYEEVHASSVGACVAGLKSISKTGFVQMPMHLVEKGEESLKNFCPENQKVSLLTWLFFLLFTPLISFPKKMAREIVRHLEYHLERDRGVIRYKNDRYYNKNEDKTSEEAEWCFGFPWLAIIYGQFRNLSHSAEASRDEILSKEYLEKSLKTIYKDQIPELYYSDSDKPNDNIPLSWAEAMFVVALLKAGK